MATYTESTAKEKLKSLPGWTFQNNAIERKLAFKSFTEAMSFMVRVSYVCEKMNHHPDWTNVYNKITIRLSTHDSGGVTDKDFQLAISINEIDWSAG